MLLAYQIRDVPEWKNSVCFLFTRGVPELKDILVPDGHSITFSPVLSAVAWEENITGTLR
jgi:hypothetical protein